MRIAVLTDIHANREAFEAVLADVAARGADRIVILGDVVGYGPDPEWCCEKVAALLAAGAVCLRGNHDSAVSGTAEGMNSHARSAIDWTRTRLSAAQTLFLGALPMTATADDVLFVHASAKEPEAWSYVTTAREAVPSFRACDARVILCGHVHVPLLVSYDRGGMVREQVFPAGQAIPLSRSHRWLAVVGAVGQPRDGVPEAGYVMLDTGANDLTLRRVAYDIGATVRKIRDAGLSESLALRLLRGT